MVIILCIKENGESYRNVRTISFSVFFYISAITGENTINKYELKKIFETEFFELSSGIVIIYEFKWVHSQNVLPDIFVTE